MKSQAVEDLLAQIDLAIDNISGMEDSSPLQKSYLAKFLTVLISGIYEEAIKTILNEKIARLDSREVSSFVENSLRSFFRNPSVSNITSYLRKFSLSWGDIISNFDYNARDALDSIVNNKNDLAHGSQINLTLREVIDYYNLSRPIIEKIDDIVL